MIVEGTNPESQRGLHVYFALCRWPYATDDDGIAADCVDDFPAAEDELAPTAVMQLLKNRSRFGLRKEILRAVVDTVANARGRGPIGPGYVTNDRFDVVRSSLSPN